MTPDQRKLFDALKSTQDEAESLISAAVAAGLGPCECDGEVPIGKKRCRRNQKGLVTCHRCDGDDRWTDLGTPCNPGSECDSC